jgi:hypothetical protein
MHGPLSDYGRRPGTSESSGTEQLTAGRRPDQGPRLPPRPRCDTGHTVTGCTAQSCHKSAMEARRPIFLLPAQPSVLILAAACRRFGHAASDLDDDRPRPTSITNRFKSAPPPAAGESKAFKLPCAVRLQQQQRCSEPCAKRFTVALDVLDINNNQYEEEK